MSSRCVTMAPVRNYAPQDRPGEGPVMAAGVKWLERIAQGHVMQWTDSKGEGQ